MINFNIINDYLLKEGYDSIIPLIIRKREKEVIIECYEEISNIVKDFFEGKREFVFNDDFVNELSIILKQFLDKYGYNPESYSENEAKIEYICNSETIINKDVILPSTIELTNEDDSLLEFGLDCAMDENDNYSYLACGTVINGQIISACTENSHVLPIDETELGIETVEGYENKGYASSALALETSKLIENGRKKIYFECEESNISSIKCAEKVGFELLGSNYYFIANKR